jgi:hypothetical protein
VDIEYDEKPFTFPFSHDSALSPAWPASVIILPIDIAPDAGKVM